MTGFADLPVKGKTFILKEVTFYGETEAQTLELERVFAVLASRADAMTKEQSDQARREMGPVPRAKVMPAQRFVIVLDCDKLPDVRKRASQGTP